MVKRNAGIVCVKLYIGKMNSETEYVKFQTPFRKRNIASVKRDIRKSIIGIRCGSLQMPFRKESITCGKFHIAKMMTKIENARIIQQRVTPVKDKPRKFSTFVFYSTAVEIL